MKVGLIVECTMQGLERIVCPKILQLLAAEAKVPIEHTIETMTNKKQLILDAAKTAEILLDSGYERVVILWDENPPWTPEKDFADERCWHIEREQLLTNLANAQLDRRRIGLVCIEREFETWLLHDVKLVRNVISTTAHPAKIKKLPDPMLIEAPKRFLMGLFRKSKAHYNPDVAAKKFADSLDKLDSLKRCDTFRYFAQAVLGRMPKGWKSYTYAPKGPKD